MDYKEEINTIIELLSRLKKRYDMYEFDYADIESAKQTLELIKNSKEY
jgi:hypothetical protein